MICTIDPSAIADRLGLRVGELAAICGVHRNTVRSAPNSPKLQGALIEIKMVLSAFDQKSTGSGRAEFFFRNLPIPSMGHKTAAALLRDHCAEDIIDAIKGLPI